MAPSIGLSKIEYGEEKENLPLDREAGIVGQKLRRRMKSGIGRVI